MTHEEFIKEQHRLKAESTFWLMLSIIFGIIAVAMFAFVLRGMVGALWGV